MESDALSLWAMQMPTKALALVLKTLNFKHPFPTIYKDNSLSVPLDPRRIQTRFDQCKKNVSEGPHLLNTIPWQYYSQFDDKMQGRQGIVNIINVEGRRLALKCSPLSSDFLPLSEQTLFLQKFLSRESKLNHREPLVLREPVADAAISFILGAWKASGIIWGVPLFYGSALIRRPSSQDVVYQAMLTQCADTTLYDLLQTSDTGRRGIVNMAIDCNVPGGEKALLTALFAQLLAQLSQLQLLLDYHHQDIHMKNLMVCKVEDDLIMQSRVYGENKSFYVRVQKTNGNTTLYEIPTYGRLILLIDQGRANCLINRETGPPQRVASDYFLRGSAQPSAACPLPSVESGKPRLHNDTIQELLARKDMLSPSDDVVRVIETIARETAGATGESEINERTNFLREVAVLFPDECNLIGASEKYNGNWQLVGIDLSRGCMHCSMRALPVFELYAAQFIVNKTVPPDAHIFTMTSACNKK